MDGRLAGKVALITEGNPAPTVGLGISIDRAGVRPGQSRFVLIIRSLCGNARQLVATSQAAQRTGHERDYGPHRIGIDSASGAITVSHPAYREMAA